MGTNSVPLQRESMGSPNHENQADVIEAFYYTSMYLDDLLNIDTPYFEGMVIQISKLYT